MKTHFTEGQNKFYDFVRINMPERYGDLDMSSSALAELVYSEDIVLSSGHFYDRSIRPCFTSALSYNEEKYHVFYEPLASNLMPSIKVAERGGKMDK